MVRWKRRKLAPDSLSVNHRNRHANPRRQIQLFTMRAPSARRSSAIRPVIARADPADSPAPDNGTGPAHRVRRRRTGEATKVPPHVPGRGCLEIRPFPRTCSRRNRPIRAPRLRRSEEHTSELQSRVDLVCRLLLEKKKDQLFEFTLRLCAGKIDDLNVEAENVRRKLSAEGEMEGVKVIRGLVVYLGV